MEELKEYAGYALAGLVAIIAWFSKRSVKVYDDGLLRITQLEQTRVTHDQLEKTLAKLTADSNAKHGDNIVYLNRIEDKLNKQEGDFHNLALRVAAIKAILEERIPRPNRE